MRIKQLYVYIDSGYSAHSPVNSLDVTGLHDWPFTLYLFTFTLAGWSVADWLAFVSVRVSIGVRSVVFVYGEVMVRVRFRS